MTGILVNRNPNLRCSDCVKAILHNCLKLGPAGEDRDGHRDFRPACAATSPSWKA